MFGQRHPSNSNSIFSRFFSSSSSNRGGYQPANTDADADADGDTSEEREMLSGNALLHHFKQKFGPLASPVLFISVLGTFFMLTVFGEEFSTASTNYQGPRTRAPLQQTPGNSSSSSGSGGGSSDASISSGIVAVNASAMVTILPPLDSAVSLQDHRESAVFYWFLSMGIMVLLIAVLRALMAMRRVFAADARRGSLSTPSSFLNSLSSLGRRGRNLDDNNLDLALSELAGMGAFRGMRGPLGMLGRDLTPADYEALSALDGGNTLHEAPRGASEAMINRLPLHTVTAAEVARKTDTNNNKTCSICLAPFEEGASVRTVVCMHSFHRGCIDPWLRMRSTCPVCKTSISNEGTFGQGV